MKHNSQITVHLPDEIQQAVQNLANQQNISTSEWVRNLINKELANIYLQAKNTMLAVRCIENCENLRNATENEKPL
ncbi:ribbon-helix-helix protein, CopG family [Moraxella boevrei]|uniref:ribbon-helix-helix protein, CopG family n=1 Tax=Faucicola boevrei TaxID=346665 RepID=UPI003735873E